MFTKEDKKFFRGKKWNKKQRKELDKQGNPPFRLPKGLFSFAEMEAMNKAEIAEKLALKPFCGENENLKGGAEMQQEACKGKTIEEMERR